MNPTAEEFDSLVSSIKVQMDDGQGELLLELGVGGSFCFSCN